MYIQGEFTTIQRTDLNKHTSQCKQCILGINIVYNLCYFELFNLMNKFISAKIKHKSNVSAN